MPADKHEHKLIELDIRKAGLEGLGFHLLWLPQGDDRSADLLLASERVFGTDLGAPMRARPAIIISIVTALLGSALVGRATVAQATTTPCPADSTRTDIRSWGQYRKTLPAKDRPKYECVARYLTPANRGRLDRYLKDSRVLAADPAYSFSYQPEAIAQARFIARINSSGGSSINPSVQWETATPNEAWRMDILTRAEGGGYLVLEAKGEWYQKDTQAQAQVDKYIENLNTIHADSADRWSPGSLAADSYRRGEPCPGNPDRISGFQYQVASPLPGVLFITHARLKCDSGGLTDEQLDAVEDTDRAIDAAEDGAESIELPAAEDGNRNGVPDVAEIAAAAGDGDVDYLKALDIAYHSSQLLTHISLKELQLYDLELRGAAKRVGAEVAERLAVSAQRAAADVAAGISAEVAGSALAAELSGMELRYPVKDVVGSRAAAALDSYVGRSLAGKSLTIAERDGIVYLVRTLDKEATAQLAKIFAKYAGRMVAGSALSLIPVAGLFLSAAFDGYQLACVVLDVADLLGYNVWGDPHLVTLDRRIYDLQSAGEFVLVRSGDSDAIVQGRFRPTSVGSNVSVMTAIAVGYGASRFEMNGTTALLDGSALGSDDYIVDDSGLAIAQINGRRVAISPDGISLAGSEPGNVAVFVADGITTAGLLGNNDNDPSNDLALVDGTILANPTSAELHGTFADAWRITDQSSLFTYAAGQSTASFTDRGFPANIVTLGDFTPTELDAANALCITAGVSPGSRMDACMLDLLVTSDDKFTQAAAAAAAVMDPGNVSFESGGVLRQSFDGAVSGAFAPRSVIDVDGTSRAVGPLFDDAPYAFALSSVPRHDVATVSARFLVLQSLPFSLGGRRVVVDVDGLASATFDLEGLGSVVSGPQGSSISADGEGTTPGGTSYRAYLASVPVSHFGDALRVRFSPQGVYSILGTALAVDSVEVSLAAPAADVVGSLTVPFVAGSEQGTGLGSLESAGAEDDYLFSISQASGPLDLLLETIAAPAIRAEVRKVPSGELVAPTDLSNHKLYRALPVGDYRLVVTSKGGPVSSYALPVLDPVPQVFDVAIGDRVEPGKIAGRDVAGAGVLETTGSKDVYRFTVADDATVVFDGWSWPLINGVLVRASGEVVGRVYNHHEYDLAAGDYRIEVVNTADIGGYTLASFFKPAPQVFDVTLGDRIEPGRIAGQDVVGAGVLETTGSKDVYRFTVAEESTIVFDGRSWPLINGILVRGSDSGLVGSVYNHHEYTLAAGEYRIEVANTGDTGGYNLSWFVKPSPQVFDVQVGDRIEPGKIAGQSVVGAGVLETTGSKDVYRFTLGEASVLAFDGGSWPLMNGMLVRESDGGLVGSVYNHHEYTLAAGAYRIEVANTGDIGGYNLSWFVKPSPQVFDVQVGDRIEPGKIAGRDVAGAGVLETTGSKDVYRFTVAEESTIVFDGRSWPLLNGVLVRGSDSGLVGSVYNHHEYLLASGEYRIEVANTGDIGGYNLAWYVKPAAQVFDYQIGQRVTSGHIDSAEVPGAGMLETGTSRDVYTFALSGAERVVFDGSDWHSPLEGSHLIRVSDGADLGRIDGHREYDLEAGAYRVEVAHGEKTGGYGFTSYFSLPQGPIADKWTALGGSNSWLGLPDGSQECGSEVCWRSFQHGQVMAIGDQAWATTDLIRQRWLAQGGAAGVIGLPAGDAFPVPAKNGYGQAFAGGSIYAHTTTSQAFAVLVPIRDVWAGSGWEAGSLGWPTADQVCDAETRMCWQSFTGGQVMSTDGGAWATTDGVRSRWLSAGGPDGVLGSPVRGLSCGLRQGACYQEFQGGSIYQFTDGTVRTVLKPIRDTWATNGWEGGWLGYPSADQVCDAATKVCWQSFTGGQIMSANGGAWTTDNAIRQRWIANGGPAGDLGMPVGALETYSGGKGQGFVGGAIFWSPATGAHAVPSLMWTAYANQRWFNGPLGYPTSEQVCDSDTGVCWQTFAGGQLMSANGQVWTTDNAIRQRWIANGGPAGDLGMPVGALETYSGGKGQGFVGGAIFWSPATGAHAVPSLMWTAYANQRWFNGPLGYPTSEQVCDSDTGVCWQTFAGGQLMSANGQVWGTTELLRKAWIKAGASSGALGSPVRGSSCGLLQSACYQEFENGSIYQFANSSVRTVLKPIRDAWAANGWEGGSLGYPAGDQTCDTDAGVCWQKFEHGQIVAVGTTAWITIDAIREAWLAAGGPAGALGKPTAAVQTYSDNGKGQSFEHGSILWTEQSGAHPVVAPITAVHTSAGGRTGTYGYPTTDMTCTDTECGQTFAGGTITAPR